VRSDRVRAALAAPLLGVVLVGCGGAGDAPATDAPTGRAASPAGHPALAEARAGRSHLEVAQPVAVRLPRIAVTSEVIPLGKAPDGTVEVPQDPDQVGWYAGGPRPGGVGPAVLLGHVNSERGPAIFYRLDQLRPGDEVLVDRADGSQARFEVTSTEQWRKDGFPTADVYHPTLRPELRLVTCGGPIDPRTGRHRDNVIVYAVLAG
jgi:hypothetical protein